MIAALTILATFAVLGLPTAAILIPWAMITGDATPLYRASLFVVRSGLRLGGIRVRVTGLDNVPAGVACIFMSNHVSNLDPPVLIPLIPGRTSFFLKRSLMNIPLLGVGMRLAEFIPVERAGTVEGARASTQFAKEVLNKGIHITTFVEGTRSRDGELLPFKKGPFYLAMESGAPCIPISISGTLERMRKGSSRIVPGNVDVVFHPPVYPESVTSREELMLAVRNAIESGLRLKG